MRLAVSETPLREMAGPMPVILAAISRLQDCIEAETEVLRAGAREGLEPFTHQKNVGLLDLTRALRLLGAVEPPCELIARLHMLRQALDENKRVLAIHLSAAQEIADLLQASAEEETSDGTYSAHHIRQMS